MADEYIDAWEVGEYGGQCVRALGTLAGVAPLLDAATLQTQVQAAVDRVSAELQKAGIQRSDLRGRRQTADEAAAEGKTAIKKFHRWLGSLDDDVDLDREAFFRGMKLGPVSTYKPADVKGRLDDLILGFAAARNATMPERANRLQKLTTARDALATALSGKGGASAQKLQGSAELVAARKAFLFLYNKVAKPMVRGQLAALGREQEMKAFFPDLAVNEGSRRTARNREPQATEPQPSRSTPALSWTCNVSGQRAPR